MILFINAKIPKKLQDAKTASEAARYNCGNAYHLVWESPRFGPDKLRAAHSIDLPFLIETIKNEGMVEYVTRGENVDTTGWYALSDRIRDMLVNFMKTGVPTEDKTVFRQFDLEQGWTTVVRSVDEIFTMPLPKPERVNRLSFIPRSRQTLSCERRDPDSSPTASAREVSA